MAEMAIKKNGQIYQNAENGQRAQKGPNCQNGHIG